MGLQLAMGWRQLPLYVVCLCQLVVQQDPGSCSQFLRQQMAAAPCATAQAAAHRIPAADPPLAGLV